MCEVKWWNGKFVHENELQEVHLPARIHLRVFARSAMCAACAKQRVPLTERSLAEHKHTRKLPR